MAGKNRGGCRLHPVLEQDHIKTIKQKEPQQNILEKKQVKAYKGESFKKKSLNKKIL